MISVTEDDNDEFTAHIAVLSGLFEQLKTSGSVDVLDALVKGAGNLEIWLNSLRDEDSQQQQNKQEL